VFSPTYLRSSFLVLVVALTSCGLLCSQSSQCVDNSPAVTHKSREIRINIVGVEFTRENFLSDHERAQLVDKIQRMSITVSPEEQDTYWANWLRGATVNKALHAQGYIDTGTTVTPYLVRAEFDQRSYVVSFDVGTGPQYRIGQLQVVEATAFSPIELRELIQSNPGEVFDEDKISQGVEFMKQRYGANGYIDMTAGPTIALDKSKGLVGVSVQVEEGRQYRVGTVEIFGLSSKAEKLLTSILEPGQIFNRQSFRDFLKVNRSLFPIDASDSDITVGRNLEEGTLDIVLDFRRCSDKTRFLPAHHSADPWNESILLVLSDQWFELSE
jgi:outer membrane protein assembly factor BamA